MPSYRSRTEGFTLVELLVVLFVGYIVLVALYIYSEHDSMGRATRVSAGNKGRGIVFAIITENMNREAAGRTNAFLWPKVGQIDPQDSNSVFTATSTSNEYFAWLLADKRVESLTSPSVLAGSYTRVAPAASLDELRTGNHNIWHVVANLDTNEVGDPPFLCTRNFDLQSSMLQDEGDPKPWSRKDRWRDNLGAISRDQAAVVVTRGAAVSIIRRRSMTRARFVGDSVFNCQTNRNAVIWGAVAAPSP